MRKIYLFLLIGISAQGFAQVSIDSLIRKGNFELYEHPDKAIQIGIDVVNDKKATMENKIAGYFLLSTAYTSQRNYAKSLDYAVKAAELVPKINKDDFKIISYTRLGVQYQQLKIYSKAHYYLDKAIEVASHSKQKMDIHKLLGFNYAIRGMVYKEQMSCDIALNYFNKSFYHYRLCLKESLNDANVSVIIYNKGNCFLTLDKIDSARISFNESYRYADGINANSLKAFANKGLAEVDTYQGKYQSAIQLLSNAEKMAQGIGDDILDYGIYKGLSDNYLLTNQMDLHEKYSKKSEEAEGRMRQNNAKTLNQFVLQVDSEGENELKQVKSDWLYFQILLGMAFLLLLGLLVFEVYRSRKKYNALKIQRQTLENLPFTKVKH